MIYNVTIILRTFTFYINMTTVVLYYDFFLTLKDEMHLFWKRKWGFITFLFFANRYFALVADAPFGLLHIFSKPGHVVSHAYHGAIHYVNIVLFHTDVSLYLFE